VAQTSGATGGRPGDEYWLNFDGGLSYRNLLHGGANSRGMEFALP
jgi:hypothetical protein